MHYDRVSEGVRLNSVGLGARKSNFKTKRLTLVPWYYYF